MSKKTMATHLGTGVKITDAKNQRLLQLQAEALQEVFPDNIIVQIVFKESLGNLNAYHSRAGKTIAKGELIAVGVGQIILKKGQSGDVISVDGDTEGSTAQLTILNADTDPKTPIDFKDGDSKRFDVL